jgi:hypothetical protein
MRAQGCDQISRLFRGFDPDLSRRAQCRPDFFFAGSKSSRNES